MTREEFYTYLNEWSAIETLTSYLVEHPEEISMLVQIGLHDSQKESWRALWIVDKIHEKKPALIGPYLPQFIDSLHQVTNESKLRHLLKIISLNPILPDRLTFLLDFSIAELTNAARPIAIRVHAMQLLYEIALVEPELRAEVIQLIEHEMTFHASPGILSRGKKILKKIHALGQT
ncbi:hypothetical protein [uncultured Sunxiuqinia sp.]|uniref:hypothetical protein n=1 Tax=Sunxiuqinia rutila TaxID=1397841 RepID=UPI00261D04B3|nr:hypothetical protein [uncultured Sunxiuqinia sp.]